MSGTRRLIILVAIIFAVAAMMGSATLFDLNRVSVLEQGRCLNNSMALASRLIETVHRSADSADSARELLNGERNRVRLNDDKGVYLARQTGERMEVFLDTKEPDGKALSTMPWNSPEAEPARRALSGELGVTSGRGRNGNTVIAAYEPVRGAPWGVVAHSGVVEFRNEYAFAAALAFGASLFAAFLGGACFVWLVSPLLASLSKSECNRRAVFDSAFHSCVVLTLDGRLIDVNRAVSERWGIGKSLRGMPLWDAFSNIGLSVDREVLKESIRRAASGETVLFETTIQFGPTGAATWEVSVKPIVDAAGAMDSLILEARDVTERNRMEEALRKSEFQFQQIAENISAAVWLRDEAALKLTYMNPAFETIWGRSLQEVMGTPRLLFPFIHPEDLECVKTLMAASRSDASCAQFRIVRPDGSVRWVWSRTFPIMDSNGRIAQIAGVTEDITDLKQAEEALLASRKSLSMALEAAGMATWDWYLDKDFAKCEGLHYAFPEAGEESEIQGVQSWNHHHVHPSDLDDLYAAVARARELKSKLEVEFRIVQPDGSVRWLNCKGSFVQDGHGNTERMMGVTYDISMRKEAERAASHREQEFRNLVENTPDAIIRCDREGRIVYSNPATGAVLGLKPESLSGTYLADLPVPEAVRQVGIEATREALQRGISTVREINFSTAWFDVRYVPEHDENGRIVSALCIARDISAAKSESLTAARLAAIVESSSDAIIGSDIDGHITNWNRGAQRLYGYTASEMMGRSGECLYPDKYKDQFQGLMDRVRTGICIPPFETSRVTKDGLEVDVSVSLSPVIDAQGCIIGSSVIARDISERKRSENAVEECDRRMRTLLSHLPGMAYRFRPGRAHVLEFTSDGCLELTGYLPKEITGLSRRELSRVVDPADRRSIQAQVKRALAQRKAFDLTYRIRTPQGEEKWVLDRGQGIWNDGKLESVEGFIADITDKVKAEENVAWGAKVNLALADLSKSLLSKDSLKDIADSALALACSLTESPCGHAGLIDRKAAALHFKEGEDCRGTCPRQEFACGALQTHASACDSSQSCKQCISVLVQVGEDWVGCICVGGRPRVYTDRERFALQRIGNLYALTIRHKRDVEERQEMEKVLSGVLETSFNAILVLRAQRDEHGVIVGFTEVLRNPAASRFLDAGDPDGAGPARLLGTQHTEHLLPEFVQVAETGKPLDREYTFNCGAGMEYVRCAAAKLGDGIAVTFSSLTEQYRLRDQLNHAQRLEAVGQLAGGVAHDFNNVLTVIRGVAECMRAEAETGSAQASDLETIHRAATRAAGLTRQLLAFSRGQVFESTVLNLNEIIEEEEKMLKHLIGENIELITKLDPQLQSVKADAGQMEQVLMNLAINARDAMPEGGLLTVETSTVVLSEGSALAHVGLKAGPYVMVTVSDSGCGMSHQVQNRLFEPFFSTKEVGKGTGLGLSTVYGIVKQCGGHIEVYSEEGEGSIFRIYLPCAEELPLTNTQDRINTEVKAGQGTILVVEDEEPVRLLVKRVLKHAGYRVLDAANGGEGLEIAQAYGREIDVVMSDVVMPRMSGPAMALRLLELGLQPKFIFLSGYSDRSVKEWTALIPKSTYAQKPFSYDSLLQIVHQSLEEQKLAS